MTKFTTLYVTLDEGSLNERVRAMRLLLAAMHAQAGATRGVVALRPGDRGFVRGDDGTPVAMRPGDILLIGSNGWLTPGFLDCVQAGVSQGATVVLLLYDIARLRRPEWFNPADSAAFSTWLDTLLALAGLVLVPSTATAKDLAAYRRQNGQAEPSIQRIRLGGAILAADPPLAPCPIERPFVLLAAPIDARNNQVVLVEAWRRLGARVPAELVPRLVFAGAAGPLVNDLLGRLARGIDKHIVTLFDPDDATLAALYRDCEFVLFPALYEGWGLAVTQSLALGKPVFAANSMALPEAGGRLARYFDPLDPEDIARHVERVLRDVGDLMRWRAEIARDFRKVEWADTASAVLEAIG
jgi:glycosyltransferase involved in cell wall biosynthesis